MKEWKNFRFLKVKGAGHMVPMDKPREALEMLDEFVRWTLEEVEG
jgi:carboxypeptidase C (cathepsin A)